jgi:hypothetical protein
MLVQKRGQTRVTLALTCSIHALSWVVICAAKYLSLQFPTILITQRSLVQIHPPQPKFIKNFREPTPIRICTV